MIPAKRIEVVVSVFVNDIGGQFSNQNRGNGSQFVSEG